MPRVCTVCTHAERGAIDRALATGTPNRRIATQYGLSEASVRRHAAEHLPATLVKAQEAEDVRQALDVVQQLTAINQASLDVLKQARDRHDGELALKAVDRVQKQIELQAKLLGELNDQPVVTLWLAPEWLAVRTALLIALQSFPEARQAVAAALLRLERAA